MASLQCSISDEVKLIHTSIKTAEGYAVHFEHKCNALAPVNGAAECKIFNGIKMCALTCSNGYKHGHTTLYICNMDSGIWAPGERLIIIRNWSKTDSVKSYRNDVALKWKHLQWNKNLT